MPNKLKKSAGGTAIQITKAARQAGMLKDNNDENPKLAKVRIYSFDRLLVAIDIERMNQKEISEIIIQAIEETQTVFDAQKAGIQSAGNGYQLQLPPAEDAGFEIGDMLECQSAPSLLIFTGVGVNPIKSKLLEIRRTQLSNDKNEYS